VRPYKHDPAEEKAERDRKVELAAKKQALWQYLLRWCSTTYADVFSAWIHLKAIRLYVESVLRYGLPVSFTAVLMEPLRQRESKLRQELKQLYGKLAGGNVNLAAAENEPDISGLTSGEFYPYVYLPVNLLD
jgi:V-type H+-transporting ATPase subunit C